MTESDPTYMDLQWIHGAYISASIGAPIPFGYELSCAVTTISLMVGKESAGVIIKGITGENEHREMTVFIVGEYTYALRLETDVEEEPSQGL